VLESAAAISGEAIIFRMPQSALAAVPDKPPDLLSLILFRSGDIIQAHTPVTNGIIDPKGVPIHES
jgi:hypothetical protein